MTHSQARRFGQMIRTRRRALELRAEYVAAVVGVNEATVRRFETGEIRNPKPQALQRLAMALQLPLDEVLTAAGYPVNRVLPEPGPYLRAKYRDLPASKLAALSKDVQAVLARYGVDADAVPKPGEDEDEEVRHDD